MTNNRKMSYLLSALVVVTLLSGCIFLPGGRAVESATVVYTAGARQHTAAVEIPIEAREVFDALVRIIKDNPDVEVIKRNDNGMLIEVAQSSKRITGQVTKLGSGNSLLYVWADSGTSGRTGRDLAISAVEIICDELGVAYELVNY
jgi:hypothetical protein